MAALAPPTAPTQFQDEARPRSEPLTQVNVPVVETPSPRRPNEVRQPTEDLRQHAMTKLVAIVPTVFQTPPQPTLFESAAPSSRPPPSPPRTLYLSLLGALLMSVLLLVLYALLGEFRSPTAADAVSSCLDMGYAKVRSFGRSKRAWRLGFLLGLGVGMGAAIPLPKLRRRPHRLDGEKRSLSRSKCSGSLEAGRARLALSPPQPSPTGPIVRVIGESEALGVAKALTGWHMSYNLILDAATLLPKRMEQVDTGKSAARSHVLVNGKSF